MKEKFSPQQVTSDARMNVVRIDGARTSETRKHEVGTSKANKEA